MAGNNFKVDRLAEQLKYTINEVVNQELQNVDFVTIVGVEITKDLGDAKVFFQCLDPKDENKTLRSLDKAKGFIKKRVAEEVSIRRIPNLIFKYDNSLDNYNRIDTLLKEAQKK